MQKKKVSDSISGTFVSTQSGSRKPNRSPDRPVLHATGTDGTGQRHIGMRLRVLHAAFPAGDQQRSEDPGGSPKERREPCDLVFSIQVSEKEGSASPGDLSIEHHANLFNPDFSAQSSITPPVHTTERLLLRKRAGKKLSGLSFVLRRDLPLSDKVVPHATVQFVLTCTNVSPWYGGQDLYKTQQCCEMPTPPLHRDVCAKRETNAGGKLHVFQTAVVCNLGKPYFIVVMKGQKCVAPTSAQQSLINVGMTREILVVPELDLPYFLGRGFLRKGGKESLAADARKATGKSHPQRS